MIKEEKTEMPFARWESFPDCVNEQLGIGHSEQSAKKICGSIQARAEKGLLFKAERCKLDIISKGDDLVVDRKIGKAEGAIRLFPFRFSISVN